MYLIWNNTQHKKNEQHRRTWKIICLVKCQTKEDKYGTLPFICGN